MITTLIQIVDGVLNLWKKKDDFKLDGRALITNVAATTSLTDVAKLARVEPLAVVSRECLSMEVLPDVMQSMLNIFIGYYLQAIAIGARIDSVKVIKTLDRLNPDRDATGFLLASSLESIKDCATLDLQQYEYKLPRLSLEARGNNNGNNGNGDPPPPVFTYNATGKPGLANISKTDDTTRTTTAGREVDDPSMNTVRDIGKVLNETANLAVGKVINVEINVSRNYVDRSESYSNHGAVVRDDPNDIGVKEVSKEKTESRNKTSEVRQSSTSIPVMVRLSPSILPDASIVKIMALHTQDDSFVERFHAWRSGRISFIKDLVLCQDMIDEHKKALMHDQEGTYSEIMRRVNNSRKYGLLTQNPSLATASNLFVISDSTAMQIERKLGGKLSNPKIRELAFESTYAMIIAVIDTRFNRVVFYHRGISAATDVSINEIKAASKGKGPDIMDIFKAYQLGNAPSY